MEKNPDTIPSGISEYIRKHFHENYLTEIHRLKDKNGKPVYSVEVSHDDNLYHLKFDEKGDLLKQELEPLTELPEDEIGNTE